MGQKLSGKKKSKIVSLIRDFNSDNPKGLSTDKNRKIWKISNCLMHTKLTALDRFCIFKVYRHQRRYLSRERLSW